MYKMYYMYTNTSSGCCRLYTYFCCVVVVGYIHFFVVKALLIF